MLPPPRSDHRPLPTQCTFHAGSMHVPCTLTRKNGQDATKRGPRALKMPSRRFKSPPRTFQEAFKKPFWHLQHRCCDSDPVLVPFLSQKRSPRTLKIKEFRETSSKFCDFALFSSSRLRDPILDPPGLRFGSLLAFEMPPRPSQERPRHAQERPRGLQDHSKSPKSGPGGDSS